MCNGFRQKCLTVTLMFTLGVQLRGGGFEERVGGGYEISLAKCCLCLGRVWRIGLLFSKKKILFKAEMLYSPNISYLLNF